MPRTELDQEATAAVLAAGDVVRVAFQADGYVYLIPFGYVWMDSALHGVTEPGKKTRIASERPEVAFQVDTSAVTGLFEWESVTGHGRFEILEDAEERGRVLASLGEFAQTAPDWWRNEQMTRIASGGLLAWRLTPLSVTGARYAPEEAP